MAWVKWANCENGEVPDSLTVVVGTFGQKELRLNPAAADAFQAWDAEFFERTGIHIEFSETGRNIATQDYLWDGWINKRPGFFPAAKPKTSTHGEWTAGDVRSSVYSARMDLHDILVETGLNHGWSWALVGEPSGEPWHFNFIGDPLSMTVAQYIAKYTEKDWFDMATQAELEAALINVLGSDTGQTLIKRAVFQNDISADADTAFKTGVKSAVREYFATDEGIDRVAQGVLKNDTSDDGKAALKTALS